MTTVDDNKAALALADEGVQLVAFQTDPNGEETRLEVMDAKMGYFKLLNADTGYVVRMRFDSPGLRVVRA